MARIHVEEERELNKEAEVEFAGHVEATQSISRGDQSSIRNLSGQERV